MKRNLYNWKIKKYYNLNTVDIQINIDKKLLSFCSIRDASLKMINISKTEWPKNTSLNDGEYMKYPGDKLLLLLSELWFSKEKFWITTNQTIYLHDYVPILNIWDQQKWKEYLKFNSEDGLDITTEYFNNIDYTKDIKINILYPFPLLIIGTDGNHRTLLFYEYMLNYNKFNDFKVNIETIYLFDSIKNKIIFKKIKWYSQTVDMKNLTILTPGKPILNHFKNYLNFIHS